MPQLFIFQYACMQLDKCFNSFLEVIVFKWWYKQKINWFFYKKKNNNNHMALALYLSTDFKLWIIKLKANK